MDIKEKNEISMIIPVYNEAKTINALIDNIEQFKDYSEIIFVDGGSSDKTNKIIEEQHYRLLYSSQKGRSYQMNYGASLAKGNILLFLHADSYLPHDALDKINIIMSQGHKVGCFKIKFNSESPIMKICGFMSNLRVRLRNIAFGDQGIFIRRDFFYKLGGFAAIPLMEDYQLSIDIKENGESIILANSKIETSARRFIKHGKLKTMARMQRAQHMYRKGVDIDIIADLYKP